MPNLNITEFASVARSDFGSPVNVADDMIASRDVSFSEASVLSGALNEGTAFIRIIADANCRVVIGFNPVATATSMAIRANTVEYFGIRRGETVAVAGL